MAVYMPQVGLRQPGQRQAVDRALGNGGTPRRGYAGQRGESKWPGVTPRCPARAGVGEVVQYGRIDVLPWLPPSLLLPVAGHVEREKGKSAPSLPTAEPPGRGATRRVTSARVLSPRHTDQGGATV